MKRVTIVCVLFVLLVCASVFSMHSITKAKAQLDMGAILIEQNLQPEDSEQLKQYVKQFVEYWDEQERTLIFFVRHALIDDISKSMVRLVPLAEYGDVKELSAELASIRWQMYHVWEAEQVSLRNVF